MTHVRKMRAKVVRATKVEPNELVARFRASSGDADYLRETVNENARKLRAAGHAANGRTSRNADGSVDAEVRISIYDPEEIDPSDLEPLRGKFDRTLLAFGDETDWPREI